MDLHEQDRPPQSNTIPIPAGTAPMTCRGATCGAIIYMVLHPSSGRPHPVSIDCADGRAPMMTRPGMGISHFANCPDSSTFRTRRPVRS